MNSRKNGLQFLLLDLDVALTFMDVAKATRNQETRRRNFANARQAYKTVLLLMKNSKLDEAQKTQIKEKLRLLKTALEAAGQKV